MAINWWLVLQAKGSSCNVMLAIVQVFLTSWPIVCHATKDIQTNSEKSAAHHPFPCPKLTHNIRHVEKLNTHFSLQQIPFTAYNIYVSQTKNTNWVLEESIFSHINSQMRHGCSNIKSFLLHTRPLKTKWTKEQNN